jgi:hypothetical protein
LCHTWSQKNIWYMEAWSLGGSVGLTTIDLHGYEAATGQVNMDNQTHA